MLREFLLRGGGDRDVGSKQNRARGRGALIDGQHKGHDGLLCSFLALLPGGVLVWAKASGLRIVRQYPSSSLRKQGPILRGLSVLGSASASSFLSRAQRGMGPGVRRDDGLRELRRKKLRRRRRHAAVDHDGLAGHEARGIGAEIGHGAGDFVGFADAAQGRGGAAVLQALLVLPQRAAKSVLTRPGATQLTRTPFGPHSPARLRHSEKSAALEIP